MTFEKDKEQGKSECFHENGTIATEAFYVDGLLNGPYRKYLADGSLEAIKEYSAGVQEGVQEIFYENGPVQILPIPRGVAIAIVANPYSGTYHEDLQ